MSKFKGLSIPLALPSSELKEVSGLINADMVGKDRLFILAHGAGAGMFHPFLESIAAGLDEIGIATLRFQFPYMELGSKRPDHRTKLIATWQSVLEFATQHYSGFAFFAGGKSMGGRMASQTFAEHHPKNIRGLIFLGFPLHQPGKLAIERGDHLNLVPVPMLFLQGTRDKLADLGLVKSVTKKLSNATLHIVEGADHGFEVRKVDGRSKSEVIKELVDAINKWTME